MTERTTQNLSCFQIMTNLSHRKTIPMAKNLDDYIDNSAIQRIVHDLNTIPEPNNTFTVEERMQVYNCLKELLMYRKIGTLGGVMAAMACYRRHKNDCT